MQYLYTYKKTNDAINKVLNTPSIVVTDEEPKKVLYNNSDKGSYVNIISDNNSFITSQTSTKTSYDVGDILYSNGTLFSKTASSGYTAIAVCVIATNEISDGSKARFMSLTDIGSANIIFNAATIDLTGLNCTVSSVLSIIDLDYNGKENTLSLLRTVSGGKLTDIQNYTTAGTYKGDWYLPSFGELVLTKKNGTVINTALNTVGGTNIDGNFYHWTSTLYDNERGWMYYLAADLTNVYTNYPFQTGSSVRAFLQL